MGSRGSRWCTKTSATSSSAASSRKLSVEEAAALLGLSLRRSGACARVHAIDAATRSSRATSRHNARFAIAAEDPEPAWRALPAGKSAQSAYCFKYVRVVAPDNTVDDRPPDETLRYAAGLTGSLTWTARRSAG